CLYFLFSCSGHPRHLRSFPTRRSSDLERGNLTVAQSWFRDSEQGILTADGTAARIVIDRSTFSRLGTCEGSGGCAHSIYTGEYGDRKSTRLNSSHVKISYAVFCLKKKN